jgi:hypothetical protein
VKVSAESLGESTCSRRISGVVKEELLKGVGCSRPFTRVPFADDEVLY